MQNIKWRLKFSHNLTQSSAIISLIWKISTPRGWGAPVLSRVVKAWARAFAFTVAHSSLTLANASNVWVKWNDAWLMTELSPSHDKISVINLITNGKSCVKCASSRFVFHSRLLAFLLFFQNTVMALPKCCSTWGFSPSNLDLRSLRPATIGKIFKQGCVNCLESYDAMHSLKAIKYEGVSSLPSDFS